MKMSCTFTGRKQGRKKRKGKKRGRKRRGVEGRGRKKREGWKRGGREKKLGNKVNNYLRGKHSKQRE
jgi:hypothetical protein